VRVSKFKSKVRYRRTVGFRAALTRVQIEKIGAAKEKTATKKS
jgi:ribosomal protein L21